MQKLRRSARVKDVSRCLFLTWPQTVTMTTEGAQAWCKIGWQRKGCRGRCGKVWADRMQTSQRKKVIIASHRILSLYKFEITNYILWSWFVFQRAVQVLNELLIISPTFRIRIRARSLSERGFKCLTLSSSTRPPGRQGRVRVYLHCPNTTGPGAPVSPRETQTEAWTVNGSWFLEKVRINVLKKGFHF